MHIPDSQAPSISVVIPVYNRATSILRAVNSALNQTLQQLEVLVVDDGSSDDTVQIVGTIPDQRLRVVRMHNNRGAQSARLRGISEARGAYLVFLDSDDELLPDSIEKRLAALRDSGWPEALVYGDVLLHGKIFNFESLAGEVYPYLLKELSLCPYSVMLIPKRCFAVAGLPDPDFPSWQDDDMVLTIGRHFPVLHCGAVVAIMNVEAGSISGNKRSVVDGGRRMVAKYADEILATHGRFRLICWQARIQRSEVIALWFETRHQLSNNLNLIVIFKFLLLTIARVAIRVIIHPFFRHIYG